MLYYINNNHLEGKMNICVYGASADSLRQEYFDAAYALGALIASGGHRLVFGGGQGGLMGAAARGAHDGSGEILGIAPRFFDEPGILFPDCTEFIYTDTMRERKQLMEDESDAFIILPGGIGTFEEFFETLTLKQLGRHAKPMAMLNTLSYYDPLRAALVSAAEGGFMSRACLSLFAVCATPADALRYVTTEPCTERGSIRRLQDYCK